jgi:mannitol/fructose-specific phosphotransferase system IIA component (Ntr-type)
MPPELATSAVGAGSLADFTRRDLIVGQLRERDAAGIIGELSRILGQSNAVPDALSFYQAALNQELLSDSTARFGIAVAHARQSGVKRLQFAFGRVPDPVVWGGRGSWPVQLIFLVAVPATESTRYLHLLSGLARLAQNPQAVAKLLAAADAPSILLVLQETGLP